MQINNYTVRNLLSLFDENTVYVDKNIQRRRGNWSVDMKRDCLRSYNLGRVPAPIVFADNTACLKWLRADALRGMDEYSREYYEARIASGHDWTVLDGMHKLFDVLHGFINNQWSYTGYLTDANGVTNSDKYENVFFKDLPQRTKDAIQDAQVSVAIFGDLTAIELSDVFLNLQKGVPLNPQQVRRAHRTRLTGWIRDVAESQPLVWNHILGKTGANSIAGSGDEEWTVKLLMATARKWNKTLSKYNNTNFDHYTVDLDLVYSEGVGISPMFGGESPYDKAEFERFKKIFNLFAYIVSQLRDSKGKDIKLKNKEAWMLWYAVEYSHDNMFQIQSANDVFVTVQKTIQRLESQSHLNYSNAITAAESKGEKAPSENSYFHKTTCLPHKARERNLAKKEFLDEFTSSDVLNSASLTRGYAAAK